MAVTRKEVVRHVQFLYADNLNCPSTEQMVRHTLSPSNPHIFPPSTEWITCRNYTFLPHSNECGIRALLAITIQALHPSPHKDMLLPLMHSNLANIGRTWIASTLFNSHILTAPLLTIMMQLIPSYPDLSTTSISCPRSLIPWTYCSDLLPQWQEPDTIPSYPERIIHPEVSFLPNLTQSKLSADLLTKTLNPYAPEFTPQSHSKGLHNKCLPHIHTSGPDPHVPLQNLVEDHQ